jgi:aminocarboxymuconate-semialdehyde decarboxylase
VRIDVHAHYYTPAFMQKMWGLGCTWRPSEQILNNADVTQQRTENLLAGGVDVQMLCVGALQPYLTETRHAVEGATHANNFYREAIEKVGSHYAGFGCLPLPHVGEALAELARCLDQLHFRGINLGCSVVGQPLDSPEFEPVWQELDRRRTVVFLHPLGLAPLGTDAYDLNFTLGGRFEDTVAAVRLVRSGLLERFPNVRIIVPHLGGTVPFLWREGPLGAGLRKLYYDSINGTASALRCACETIGADRLMLGTDYPYNTPRPCADYVESAGLSSEEVTAILDRNAQEVLGL